MYTHVYVTDASDNERALYVPDDTYTKGKCSSCPRLQRCVCNVLNRRYTCASKSQTLLISAMNSIRLVIDCVTLALGVNRRSLRSTVAGRQ